ncbi:DUF6236 family protein [Amycolatopsis sp. FDAARGOS 1241]|uniref:DUF6236 family protein n=1 Tax=Amycolatopsis sp. FDAARGOS 1241 TaxID=2778070 RepID=UPI0019504D8E|nr:DUF6236 family protein [Amycolatopsis sp. FDAARGOS 1241]QRP47438.1 hypothetical protein I6J71_05585 [Amycolatopsis sp. FDAARGOS 1241]
MDQIALYYPYIHVRDDRWLKYAALYWPKMARLRPAGYPALDSEESHTLGSDAGWLVDLAPPPWAAEEVGLPFLELIATHGRELRERFGLEPGRNRLPVPGLTERPRRSVRPRRSMLPRPRQEVDLLASSWHDYVHADKVSARLIEAAVDTGLATVVEGHGGLWVGMHPELVDVYTCALVERIAAENRLHPVTDQALHHTAASGWTLERLADVLLGSAPATAGHPDAEDAFVFLAFETVVPLGLERVPVEKIIEVRTKFGAELDAFRRYVTEQSQRLAQLQDVRDLAVFREYLRTEVDHAVTEQLKHLSEQLRSVGLESVKAVGNVKSIAPPALVTMAADAVGLSPAIAGSATAAACVLAAPVQWRRERHAAIRESPVGYLFRLDRELSPAKLNDRLRRAWPAR